MPVKYPMPVRSVEIYIRGRLMPWLEEKRLGLDNLSYFPLKLGNHLAVKRVSMGYDIIVELSLIVASLPPLIPGLEANCILDLVRKEGCPLDSCSYQINVDRTGTHS